MWTGFIAVSLLSHFKLFFACFSWMLFQFTFLLRFYNHWTHKHSSKTSFRLFLAFCFLIYLYDKLWKVSKAPHFSLSFVNLHVLRVTLKIDLMSNYFFICLQKFIMDHQQSDCLVEGFGRQSLNPFREKTSCQVLWFFTHNKYYVK